MKFDATDSEVKTALHQAAKYLRAAADVMTRHRDMNDKAIIADNAAEICINWVEGMERDG